MAFHPTSSIQALLALVLAGGPLASRRRLLRSAPPLAAWQAGPLHWRQAGLDRQQQHRLLQPDPDAMARSLHWLQQANTGLLGLGDAHYPALLALAPEPPLALFVHGDASLLNRPAVALVGSRHASLPGRNIAASLARQFGAHGLCVASGLAAGIDAAAHRTCLEQGIATVAVIGTGPDCSYPTSHRPLQAAIAEAGAVVSEYPPGTPPRAGQFPARNRILAGLSLAVVVVEAAQRSGALITARLAAEAGREVFAVPGSPLHAQSRGCNRLLRDGAGLCEDASDVMPSLPALARALGQALALPPDGLAAAIPATPSGPHDPVQRQVWQALGQTAVDMDELLDHTGLTLTDLSAILLDLEMAGWVVQLHGQWQHTPAPPPPTASADAGRG